MTGFELHPYHPDMAAEWDAFVLGSPAATFQHSRRFLSYHRDRFRDRSIVWRAPNNGEIIAVLPAAEHQQDASLVVSHPGATFGGLLTSRRAWGSAIADLLCQACGHFAALGYRRMTYKPVPSIYHRMPSEDDQWALYILRAVLVGRGLSISIALECQPTPTDRRRRTLQKAMKHGLLVVDGLAHAAVVWDIFTRRLNERHGVIPVHSLEEFRQLAELFAGNIELYSARAGDSILGGVVMFHSPTVAHVQYSVASEEGSKLGAMDLLLDHAIRQARTRGARFVDFGISTDHSGEALNEGLHRFKFEFGGGGVVYDRYDIDLSRYARVLA